MNAPGDPGRIHDRMEDDGSDIGVVYTKLLILSISSDQFDPHSPSLALPNFCEVAPQLIQCPFHHTPKTLVYLWAATESYVPW